MRALGDISMEKYPGSWSSRSRDRFSASGTDFEVSGGHIINRFVFSMLRWVTLTWGIIGVCRRRKRGDSNPPPPTSPFLLDTTEEWPDKVRWYRFCRNQQVRPLKRIHFAKPPPPPLLAYASAQKHRELSASAKQVFLRREWKSPHPWFVWETRTGTQVAAWAWRPCRRCSHCSLTGSHPSTSCTSWPNRLARLRSSHRAAPENRKILISRNM